MKILNFYFFWILLSMIIISSCEKIKTADNNDEIIDKGVYCEIINAAASEIDIDDNDTIDYNYTLEFIGYEASCIEYENIIHALYEINPLNENSLLSSYGEGPYPKSEYGDTIPCSDTDILYWSSSDKAISGYTIPNNVWKEEDSKLIQHIYIPVRIKKNNNFHCGWFELSISIDDCTLHFIIEDKYFNSNPNEFCLTGIKNNSE